MGVDIEQPLLKENPPVLAYLNCPGCKISHMQDPNANFPYKKVAILAMVTLVSCLPSASLYPFLYFMVKDLNVAKSAQDIGYYAGCIGAAAMVGKLATSILWGMVADKYGRVPVMIIGIISVIVFNTIFGMSTTFWMAVLSRFLLGGFNGILGPARAYASEICNERHQAASLSTMGIMWGFALVIGPAVGGLFSQPAIKYPKLFPPGSLFNRFPYLLPSLCVTIIAIPTLFITFWLPETLHKHDNKQIKKAEEVTHKVLLKPSISAHLPPAGSENYPTCEGVNSPDRLNLYGSPQGSKSEGRLHHQGSRRSQEYDRFQIQSNSQGSERHDYDEENVNRSEYHSSEDKDVIREVYQVDWKEAEDGANLVPNSEEKLQVRKRKSLLTNKALMVSIGVYCTWSLHDLAFDEVFPLWCVSPASDGGLSLKTTDIGQVLAIAGFTMLLFQLLVFAPLVNFMGAVFVTRMGAGITVYLMAAYPFIPKLHGMTLWVVLGFVTIVKHTLSEMLFTGTSILVNNAVTQDKRGAANGLSTSFVSFFKTVGPLWGGSIFAWAQSRQDAHILPGNQLVFFALGATALITYLSTLELFLSRSLDRPIALDSE